MKAARIIAMACCAAGAGLCAQQPAAQSPAGDDAAVVGPLLEVHVRAVVIPVVVRDAVGHIVDNLKEEDFKVFDQGRKRQIAGFTVQEAEPIGEAERQRKMTGIASLTEPGRGAGIHPAEASGNGPTRYMVFLFDDRHLGIADLEETKRAAMRMLDEPLADGTRAVVLSFLGANSGMTHDRTVLTAAVKKLKARQAFQEDPGQCPRMSYYSADLILNKHSDTQLQTEIDRTATCTHRYSNSGLGVADIATATQIQEQVLTEASQSLLVGEQDVNETLDYIRDVVHTMSRLPGQRTLVLVSPGFLTLSDESIAHESQILDLALDSQVTISTLDARGLYGDGLAASDDGSGSITATVTGRTQSNQADPMRQSSMAMGELADGTGGMFFRNSNDLKGGLQALAAGPAARYLLEISLADVKQNGGYHALKVEVDRRDVKIQARDGYFAPAAQKTKK